jgi:hypothetical protein
MDRERMETSAAREGDSVPVVSVLGYSALDETAGSQKEGPEGSFYPNPQDDSDSGFFGSPLSPNFAATVATPVDSAVQQVKSNHTDVNGDAAVGDGVAEELTTTQTNREDPQLLRTAQAMERVETGDALGLSATAMMARAVSEEDAAASATPSVIDHSIPHNESTLISDRLHMEENEAVWTRTKRELVALERELAETQQTTQDLQSESDQLDAMLRTLRRSFLPETDAPGVEPLMDFLDFYLLEPSSLPIGEEALQRDWLPCAAALLTHPHSKMTKLGIHEDLTDSDAIVLSGFLRCATSLIPGVCTEINLANNQIKSPGAAAIISACVELLAPPGGGSTTDADRRTSSLSATTTTTTVLMDGNYLGAAFAPQYCQAYQDAIRTVQSSAILQKSLRIVVD